MAGLYINTAKMVQYLQVLHIQINLKKNTNIAEAYVAG